DVFPVPSQPVDRRGPLVRIVLGGKDRLDERLARAREGQRSGRGNVSMATFEASRPGVGAVARPEFLAVGTAGAPMPARDWPGRRPTRWRASGPVEVGVQYPTSRPR